jgi:transcriptional regulator with XRE-family HTH domain
LEGDPLAGQSDLPVGAALRHLRRQAGLTEHQLGRRVAMSQAKISRIESGATGVTPDDAGQIARALAAPPEVINRLIEQAERAHNRMNDWRQAGSMVRNIQTGVGRMEAGIREFRIFQPAVVIGLLQTSEYARAILDMAYRTREIVYRETGAEAVSESLSQRMRRQEALADPDRRFQLVMTETVLRNRLMAPEHMLAQLDRIRQVAELPNVSVRIIESDAALDLPPFHGFEVLADKGVVVDIFNTSLVARGGEDVQFYRHVFDRLLANATEEIGPVLDRHRRVYLTELRG